MVMVARVVEMVVARVVEMVVARVECPWVMVAREMERVTWVMVARREVAREALLTVRWRMVERVEVSKEALLLGMAREEGRVMTGGQEAGLPTLRPHGGTTLEEELPLTHLL